MPHAPTAGRDPGDRPGPRRSSGPLPLDPAELLEHARAAWCRPATSPGDPAPVGVDLVDEELRVTFRWGFDAEIAGVRIPLPTHTDHPVWAVWDPSTAEEWAEWAVRQTVVEQLHAGLTARTAPVLEDGVAWYPLDVPGWITPLSP